MRPEPFRPIGRYDPKNIPGSLVQLETSLKRQFQSLDAALLSLEPTAVKTANCTARVLDMVRVDPTAGAFDVLVPAPRPGGGWIMVKNVGTSTNAVTIRPLSSAVTIDGNATYTLASAEGACWLFPASDTEWFVLSGGLTSAPTTDDLEATLAAGNETGAYDIDVTSGQALNFLGDIDIQDGGTTYITSSATELILKPAGTTVFTLDTSGATFASGKTLDFVGVIDIKDDGSTVYSSSGTEATLPAGVLTMGGVGTNATINAFMTSKQPLVFYNQSANRADFGNLTALGKLRLLTSSSNGIDIVVSTETTEWRLDTLTFPVGWTIRGTEGSFGTAFDVLDIDSFGDVTISAYAAQTIFMADAVTFQGNVTFNAGISLAFGSNPADTGTLRFSNGDTLYWEASPAGTDVRGLTIGSDEIPILGDSTNAPSVYIDAATSIAIRPGGTAVLTVDSGGATLGSGDTLDFTGAIDIQDDGTTLISSGSSVVTLPQGAFSVGSSPATTGAGRFTGNTYLYWRISGSNLRALGADSNFEVLLGDSGSATTGAVRIGNAFNIYLDIFGGTIVTVDTDGATVASGKTLDFVGAIAIQDDGTSIYTSSGTSAVLPQGILDFTSSIDIRDDSTSFITSSATALILSPAGSTILTLDSGGATLTASTTLDWASGTAALSIGGTNWLTATGTAVAAPGTVAIGSTPATGSGLLRLSRGTANLITLRNDGDTGDLVVCSRAGDAVVLGEATNIASLFVRAASQIRLQNGTSDVATVRSTELELASNIDLQLLGTGTVNFAAGVALGGGSTATLGTIGGSGPTSAAQAGWIRKEIAGVDCWEPYWT